MPTQTKALAAVALPTVVQEAIDRQGINLAEVNFLMPTRTFGALLGEFEKVVIDIVKVDPDPKKKWVFILEYGRSDDPDSRVLGLMAKTFRAIGLAVGINEVSAELVESTERRSHAQIVGRLRKANGEWVQKIGTKTVNLVAIRKQQRFKAEDQAEKGNPDGKVVEWGTTNRNKRYPVKFEDWESDEQRQRWIERTVERAVLPYELFTDERAMTGAANRLVKSILAIDASYTLTDLEKPFAFPSILLDNDKLLANPLTRDAAISRMTGSAADVYGERRERDVTPKPAQLPAGGDGEEADEDLITIGEPAQTGLFDADGDGGADTLDSVRDQLEGLKNDSRVSGDQRVQLAEYLAEQRDSADLAELQSKRDEVLEALEMAAEAVT